jgi:hypothetical protein
MVLYRFSSIVYLAVNMRLRNMYDGLVNENLSVASGDRKRWYSEGNLAAFCSSGLRLEGWIAKWEF